MFCRPLAKTVPSLPDYSQNTASRQLQTISLFVRLAFLMFILVIQKSCHIDIFGGNRGFFDHIFFNKIFFFDMVPFEAGPFNRVPS